MTKKDLEEAVALYKEQIDFFKKQNQILLDEKEKYRLNVEKLQDALINIRAPEAYADYRADMADITGIPEDEPKDRERIRQVKQIQDTFLRSMEQPLFAGIKNAEEMEELLAPALSQHAGETPSIHDNEES